MRYYVKMAKPINPQRVSLEDYPAWHVCKCMGYEGTYVTYHNRRTIQHAHGEIWIFQGECSKCGTGYWTTNNIEALLNDPEISHDVLALLQCKRKIEMAPKECNLQ